MAEVQKSQELRRRTGPGSTIEETTVGGNAGNINSTTIARSSPNNSNNSNNSNRGQYAGSSSSNSNNNNIGNNNTNGNNFHSSQKNKSGLSSVGGSMSGMGPGSGNYYQQMQLQKPIARLDSNTRMQGAEKVEKAISQVCPHT